MYNYVYRWSRVHFADNFAIKTQFFILIMVLAYTSAHFLLNHDDIGEIIITYIVFVQDV